MAGPLLSTILGISLSVAVLVGSLWVFGAIDFMIDLTYNQSNRQDATDQFRPRTAALGLFEVSAYRA